jgi:prevent-host-death family protein
MEDFMTDTPVTMTELRQHLGDFVNRAAYGDERIVLHAHGQPRAVLVSYEEFRRLQDLASQNQGYANAWRESLERAALLRERIQDRYEVEGISPEDSTEILRQLREERVR